MIINVFCIFLFVYFIIIQKLNPKQKENQNVCNNIGEYDSPKESAFMD